MTNRIAKRILFFLPVGFIIASLGYMLLKNFFQKHVFASLFRMFYYHEQHAYQYILLVCIVYTVLMAGFFSVINTQKRWLRSIKIIAVMFLTILISSPLGGVLWHIHDMQAGYFVYGAHLRDKLWMGFTWGLQLGWLIIFYSFPYNILGLIAGYFITELGLRRLK